MPFQPPPQQNPLEQLFQLYQLQESMNAAKRQRSQEALSIALRLAESGGDPSVVQGVDPNYVPVLTGLREQALADQRRAGLQALINTGSGLSENFAGRVSSTGDIVQPDPAGVDTALQTLRGLGGDLGLDPATTDNAIAVVRNRGAATTAEREASVSEKRFDDSQIRGRAAYEQGLRTTENERQEKLRRETEQEDALAEVLFASRNPFMSGTDGSAKAQEYANAQLESLTPEARARVELKASQNQVKFDRAVAQAEASEFAATKAVSEFSGLDKASVYAIQKGFATLDPLTGGAIPGKLTDQYTQRRIALGQAVDELANVEANFWEAYKEGQTNPLTGGPVVGTELVQNILQQTGMQTGAAAKFNSSMSLFLTRLADSLIPGVPSNMDLSTLLVAFPTLSELFSESAPARFTALRDSLQIAVRAPLRTSGDLGRIVQSKQNPQASAEARAIIQRLSQTGDIGAFDAELSRFKSRWSSQVGMPTEILPSGGDTSPARQFLEGQE